MPKKIPECAHCEQKGERLNKDGLCQACTKCKTCGTFRCKPWCEGHWCECKKCSKGQMICEECEMCSCKDC